MSENIVHPFNEAGRMLLAAIKTYRLGNCSIDYTLKRHVPEVVPREWAELAESLLREAAEQMGEGVRPSGKSESPPP